MAGAVHLLAVAMLGGCATQSITASLPKVSAVAGEPSRFDGSPSEIYGAIARGAMGCWFAVNGQLKKSHIFHADVASPANGGAGEIAVLERDPAAPKPWGAKAYRIALVAAGEQTVIDIENLKMPEATATQMRADVIDWAQGKAECRLKPVEVAAPAPTPQPAKKPEKTKVKAAAR